MIDIEAFGHSAGAAIASIGAVRFDIDKQPQLGESFYEVISAESCQEMGMRLDADTIYWWLQQSEAARSELFRANKRHIKASLLSLNYFIEGDGTDHFWANGSTYDFPILEFAYEKCGLKPAWNFRQVCDARTVYHLAGVKVEKGEGVSHHARHDCLAQISALVKAFKFLEGTE